MKAECVVILKSGFLFLLFSVKWFIYIDIIEFRFSKLYYSRLFSRASPVRKVLKSRDYRCIFTLPNYQDIFITLNIFTVALDSIRFSSCLHELELGQTFHRRWCLLLLLLLFVAVCLDEFTRPVPADIVALEVFPYTGPLPLVASTWYELSDYFSTVVFCTVVFCTLVRRGWWWIFSRGSFLSTTDTRTCTSTSPCEQIQIRV